MILLMSEKLMDGQSHYYGMGWWNTEAMYEHCTTEHYPYICSWFISMPYRVNCEVHQRYESWGGTYSGGLMLLWKPVNIKIIKPIKILTMGRLDVGRGLRIGTTTPPQGRWDGLRKHKLNYQMQQRKMFWEENNIWFD